MATDVRRYDFTTTAANLVKADPAMIKEHFEFSTTLMTWFVEKGLAVLASPANDDYTGWHELFDKASYMLRDFPQTRSVRYLFLMVVERGVDCLVRLVQFAATDREREVVHDWFIGLMYQLQPGSRCGLRADVEICDSGKTRELLDKLVVVAQVMRSERYLQWIAENRHPNYDQLARDLYIAHHKNW